MSVNEDSRNRDEEREPDGSRRPVRPETALSRIGDALQGLRYGSVLAIVQDGVVVQIERTEKTRIGR